MNSLPESGPQSPAQAGDTIRLFPSAAQPNIIRAYEKVRMRAQEKLEDADAMSCVFTVCEAAVRLQDEVYLQYLTDSCHDAVRRLLGPRQALLWAR
jgi:hypothetical protein